MALIVIGLFGLFAALASSAKVRANTMETDLVTRAAAAAYENVRATSFGSVYSTYHNTTFDVPGLFPAAGETAVGRILLHVNETALPAAFAPVPPAGPTTSMDLNGDADAADADVSGLGAAPRFRLLPVEIVVRWKGVAGDREVRFYHLLTR